MSELVIVTLKMSPALRDKLRAQAVVWNQSVSAILLEGAECMLNAGPPDGAKPVPRPSVDHGIVQTADLTTPARSPAIVSQSRFAGGQVDVTLAVPLAVMASTPLAKLEEADKVRAIEDEVNQRFLYRKVVRVK